MVTYLKQEHQRSRFAGNVTAQYNNMIQDQLALAKKRILDECHDAEVTGIDVGAGLGIKSATNFAAAGITPVMITDLDLSRLERAVREYAKRGFNSVIPIQGDITDPNFDLSHQADIVTSTDVLEHLENPLAAMRNIYRLTNRFALVASPNEPNFRLTTLAAALTRREYHHRFTYIKRLGLDPKHVQTFNRRTFAELVENAGFNIVDYQQTFLKRWNVVLAEKK